MSMILLEKVVFWMPAVLILYVYFGYPLALLLLVKYSRKPLQVREITPEVTLLVCAYNEEEVIGEKIRNSLKLDYPAEKIKIVIASDGSTDKTNNIVREYKDDRLILMDYPEREGKMSVINKTVSELESDIVIFSDANTMYQDDAIHKLVRNFSDPSIGGVSADVILLNDETAFGKSESLYYRYERWIQKKESEFGSIIGVDGGMYAIRRELFVPPSSNIILDDFVISMNVALKGYRVVYEPEAVGYEKNVISSKTEFLRKSRVIAGAVQSLIQKEGVPSVSMKKLFYCYVSHKLLRWIVPLLLLLVFFANLWLALISDKFIYIAAMTLQLSFYSLSLLDLFVSKIYKSRFTSIPYYFCMVNGAALYGIYKGLFGKQSVKWQKFSR